MRFTSPLYHAKYFWWGKGWGYKPRKANDYFLFKKQYERGQKRPLEVIEQTLPKDVVPVDPNEYVKKELHHEIMPDFNFTLPWPYSKRPVRGSVEDPSYNKTAVYLYQRKKPLVEPINLPLYFTNSVLESGLPDQVQKIRSSITIDEDYVNYANRRINWCLNNDSALRKLPLDRKFPYLDQKPPRVWGVAVPRKENHLLHSLYDISNTWIAKNRYDRNVITQRISYPFNNLPLTREDQSIILDLECDFFTLLSSLKTGTTGEVGPFDRNSHSNTSNRTLKSINPISWKLGFEVTHFYNDNYEFQMPSNSSIQTIFISNTELRKLTDADYQGRAVMQCYGYAVQQAKLKYKTDNIQKIVLEKPICIQCVYTNPKDFTIGFVLFQLNTLNLTDETIRNQVWLSEPLSATENSKELIADLVAIQTTEQNDAKNL